MYPHNAVNGPLSVLMVNAFRTGGSVMVARTVRMKVTNLNVKLVTLLLMMRIMKKMILLGIQPVAKINSRVQAVMIAFGKLGFVTKVGILSYF